MEGLGCSHVYMGVTGVQPSVTCKGGKVGGKVMCTWVLQLTRMFSLMLNDVPYFLNKKNIYCT